MHNQKRRSVVESAHKKREARRPKHANATQQHPCQNRYPQMVCWAVVAEDYCNCYGSYWEPLLCAYNYTCLMRTTVVCWELLLCWPLLLCANNHCCVLPVAAWSALDDAEFLEELRDPCVANDSDKANASSEPATLRQYPDLIKHIRLILEQHGTGASERRKNTNRAFTVDISCQNVADALHNQWGEGNSRVRKGFDLAHVWDYALSRISPSGLRRAVQSDGCLHW